MKQCRICKKKTVTYLYPLNTKYSIYHCSTCNTDLTSPIPSPADVAQSTDVEYFKAYEDLSIKHFKILDLKRILEELPMNKVKSGLDIGCANAYLVEYLLSKKVDAYGIELFPEVAAEAQKKFKDKRIYVGDFEKYQFKRKFDVLIMFDLIEHIVDPQGVFEKAKKILNPGGFVLILTPDINAFNRKILKRHWTAYYVEHVHCFSKQSMEYLAEKTGLKLFHYQRFHKTVNLHYFIRHLFHKFPFFMFLNIFTRFPSINFNFRIDDNSMLVILQNYEKK